MLKCCKLTYISRVHYIKQEWSTYDNVASLLIMAHWTGLALVKFSRRMSDSPYYSLSSRPNFKDIDIYFGG